MKRKIPAGAIYGEHYTIIDGRLVPIVSGGSDVPPVIEEETPPPAPPQDAITIPNDPPPPPAGIDPNLLQDPAVQAAIEAARQQEKDKLYGRIETQEQRLAAIEAERQAEIERLEQERLAAEAEARRLQEEEMDVRTLLQTKEQEWNSKLEAIRQEAEQERAVFAMERQFQELQQYKSQVIAANSDDIMPELVDLVGGNTKEEIDASVDMVKERSLRIVQQMQAQAQNVRQQQRGVSVTAPPVGPMENDTSHRTLTAADIAAMTPEEYAKNRDKLLQSVSERARSGGIYG